MKRASPTYAIGLLALFAAGMAFISTGSRGQDQDGWLTVKDDGHELWVTPGAVVVMEGFGPRIGLKTRQRLIEFKESVMVSVDGEPVSGDRAVRAGESVRIADAEGHIFWEIRNGTGLSSSKYEGRRRLFRIIGTVDGVVAVDEPMVWRLEPRPRKSYVVGWAAGPVFVGLKLTSLAPADAAAAGVDPTRSLRVDSVVDGSPAQRANVRRGDILTSVDQERIVTHRTYFQLLQTKRADEQLNLGLIRNGRSLQAMVTLQPNLENPSG